MLDKTLAIPVVKFVSKIVCGHDIEQQDVFGLGIKSWHSELHLWKHLPEKKGKEKLLWNERFIHINNIIHFFTLFSNENVRYRGKVIMNVVSIECKFEPDWQQDYHEEQCVCVCVCACVCVCERGDEYMSRKREVLVLIEKSLPLSH